MSVPTGYFKLGRSSAPPPPYLSNNGSRAVGGKGEITGANTAIIVTSKITKKP